MGQSTDAIFVYGVALDEMEVDEDVIRDAEEALERRKDVIRLIRHCSCDYPMWILGIEHTRKVAYRGSPTLISQYGNDLSLNANWPRLLQEAATEFGITIPEDAEKFGWLIASDCC